jgi:hypothetical protein
MNDDVFNLTKLLEDGANPNAQVGPVTGHQVNFFPGRRRPDPPAPGLRAEPTKPGNDPDDQV